jgi:HD superfamily phosphohydrolase
MRKYLHEIRDPIHIFIRHNSDERDVIDSHPLQRLRYVHQLALSYLIYPGATHRRFEHSLGVMDLAGRVFDVVTDPNNVTDEIRELVPDIGDNVHRSYWRQVLRAAALCHDIGHLPFSHAAEHELLPSGWSHERLTRELILSGEMIDLWHRMTPPLRPEDIVKLAVGPKEAGDFSFSNWEAILCEVVVSDAFGVDRMDYLLRDSHHAGVAYGHFDIHRLIDCLRVLPPAPTRDNSQGVSQGEEPALGVVLGGLQSAEALGLARYLMFSQVYYHPIRQIYDLHLQDFLRDWLPSGVFPTEGRELMRTTDNDVIAAMATAAEDTNAAGHDPARRIMRREHFKVLYEGKPDDLELSPEPGKAIFQAAQDRFGADKVKHQERSGSGGATSFPVLMRDRTVASSLSLSETLRSLPVARSDFVFIAPEHEHEAETWLKQNSEDILRQSKTQEDE